MSATGISGATRLCPVLGHPVAQVMAPALVNPVLASLGTDAAVVPLHVSPGRLAETVRALAASDSVPGVLVTVPHKAAVCALADDVGEAAAASGTANALRFYADGRIRAENFDGLGFVRGLARVCGAVPPGSLVVGAGGAGSAIAVSLLMAGAPGWPCTTPTPGGSTLSSTGCAPAGPAARAPRAPPTSRARDSSSTPLGLRPGDPLPFEPATTRPDAVVADIIMKPRETRLLATAAACGRRVHPGIHMLSEQIPCYREFFAWG